jgi:plastocyanin
MDGSALILKLAVAAIVVTASFHPALRVNAADGQRIVIEIRSLKFLPSSQAVRPGDVVVWRNMDIVPHTVTAKDSSWDSGLIGAGEEWETMISGDMANAYYCRFHPSMTATLSINPKPL